MANYYLDDDGKLTNVNKKKKKKGKNYVMQDDGSLQEHLPQPTVTTTKKESDGRSWFKKGLFEDGYDFGDVTRTVLGTYKDAEEDGVKGLLGIGEGAIDFVSQGVSGVAKKLGNDKLSERINTFIEKDLIDENKIAERFIDRISLTGGNALWKAGNDILNAGRTEEASVLGEKSDALVQSAGQLAGTIGLQAVGVPWWLTTGASSFGAGVEEAYKNDATWGEASSYGAIKAGADVLTEKIFGGIKFGGKALDDGIKKKVGDLITNKAMQTATKFGWDATGEGLEEIAAEVVGNIGQWLTFDDDESFKDVVLSKEAREGYKEAFIGGAVLGGGFNTGKAYKSLKTGRDYDTGLSDSEQTVIDTESINRQKELRKYKAMESEIDEVIRKQEETVGKLTDKAKLELRNKTMEELKDKEFDLSNVELSKDELAEIEAQVKEDFDKGYITTDTIENALFPERTKKANELLEERKTADLKRRTEIDAELDSISKTIDGFLNENYRLKESYRQRQLQKEEFQVEVTEKDSDLTKGLVEEFKKHGVGNNRQAHETFEFYNKLSNDSGIKIKIRNTEELRAAGRKNPENINGFIAPGEDGKYEIVLNIDHNDVLKVVAGHEITHTLEKGEHYADLQNALKEYATTKGVYDKMLSTANALYEGVENANPENEVTAQLAGEYLLTDEAFVKKLAAEKPNIFTRVFEEIKHIYKMAVAGSKEARQLEKAKRMYEKAYRETRKTAAQPTKTKSTTEADSNTKLSIGYTKDNKSVAVIEEDIMEGLSAEEQIKVAKEQIKRFRPGVNARSGFVKVTKKSGGHFVNSNYTDMIRNNEPVLYVDKLNISQNIDDVIHASTDYVNEPLKHLRKDDIEQFGRGSVLIRSGKNDYEANVLIAYTTNGEMLFYDVQDLRPTNFELKEKGRRKDRSENSESSKTPTSLNDSISENENIVNRELTAEQQEYFKDSKVRDEEGNLKVMYHGTSAGGHTMFDPYGKSKYGLFGVGSYFTDNKSVAESYTEKGKGNNKQIYEVYLNITNPIDMDAPAIPTEWKKALPEADFPKNGTNEDFYRTMEEYFEDEGYAKWEASETALEVMESMGYDGITHIGGGRFNKKDETRHQVYIAFQPEQIKNIDNAKPTTDPDIRYSLTDNKGRTLSEGQQKRFKDSKVRDENGSLLTMYHGTPDGSFTVFKDGSYFTPNKAYADRYQNTGASSISFGKVAANPKTFEVYLDIKKPFDLSDPEARDIYINDYIKGGNAMGINPYLSDAEYDAIETIDWTEGEDLRDFLIENEYDYDGLVLDEGADGGYGDDVLYRGKSYVVFSPEQVKSVENENPTEDEDIRFSLSGPVESTRKLVAVHNMRSSELMKTLDLGGLPMPSIAIIKAQSGHSEYGDVSLLFNKETIDPKFMRANKVYGGDAWTPTYPTIEYKANKKVADKISDLYYELAREHGYDEVKPLYNYAQDLEDTLNRNKGEVGILEGLADDTGMMQVYLLASGKGKVENIEKETVEELSEAEIEMNDYFVNALGEETVKSIIKPKGEDPKLFRKKWFDAHGVEVKDTYTKFLKEVYQFTDEQVDNVLDNTRLIDYMKMVRDANNYLKNGPRTVRTEVDSDATKEKIRETAGEGYNQWLKDLFSGAEEKTGIRNNADPFTRSGNRRSWEALHWENNLENVVKVMKEQENGTGFFGGSGIFGVSAKEYGSIDEIRADSNRLDHMDQEEYEAIKESLGQRFQEIATSIMDTTERNQFIAIDNAMEVIVDAVRSSKTKSGIMNVLKQYRHLNATETTANDIVDLVKDIAAMPTEYFEAKPRRAVGLDEIAAVIIPDDADPTLMSRLEEGGYNVVTYKAGDEADRAAKLNEQNDLKFSLSQRGGLSGVMPPSRGTRWSDILMPGEEEIAPPPTTTVSNTEMVGEDIAPINPAVVERPQEPSVDMGRALSDVDLPYIEQQGSEALRHITEDYEYVEDGLPYDLPPAEVENPLQDRNIEDVGNRSVKAYMYENPEVKPFFQKEAQNMLSDLRTSTKGQRFFNDQVYYDTNGESGFFGSKRHTSEELAYLLDNFKYTYADIEKGLQAIIEDHGKENNAVSKRIEFLLDERLREGYTDFMYGEYVDPDNDYINLLREKQITEYNDEAYNQWVQSLADVEAPEEITPIESIAEESPVSDIAPVRAEIGPTQNGVQQTYDFETETITEDEKDVELERLEKRKQAGYKKLGSQVSFTSRKATELYDEVKSMRKGVRVSTDLGYILDNAFYGVQKHEDGYEVLKDSIYRDITDALLDVESNPAKVVNPKSKVESVIRKAIEQRYNWSVEEIESMKLDSRAKARQKIRNSLVEDENMMKMLMQAKDKPKLLLNNTDTVRVNEIVFGREAGNKINELVFQKTFDNEAKNIRWKNKERADLKALGIKPKSKMSAAVQKYGEGEYVNEFGDMVKYDDFALAREFPNKDDQAKIINAANTIREKYDVYIDTANDVLTGLGFDPIPKRKDYMRHFQALNDIFSEFGTPFNPQVLNSETLPTDINGMTEFFTPQKNFFANAMERTGARTTLDAITGIDEYLEGIGNLIYHTEDIQRGRALEELVRSNFGRSEGAKKIEEDVTLTDDERLERLEKIKDNHLSNYAAWLREWTNNVAGKKSGLDRGFEHALGRIFPAFDELRKQVGSNMIGFNLSSSLTNAIASVQAMAKTSKVAVTKGTVDTFKNIVIKDDFIDKNEFLTARFGSDKISKTPWERVRDSGYIFMKGMDYFTSNQIVRSKYHELISKGMSEEQAHAEAGKFAARIMGDRTKGANPLLYNSKAFNIVAQFQLEVNNQVYSMFYDTYHESKEKANDKALRTAAGMTFTLGQLFAFTHLFGKGFESLAGYNPTLDVIGIFATALGMDGDDEEDKPLADRLEDASMQLLKALPYSSLFVDGGRIPIGQALPVTQFIKGEDEYGNEKSRVDIIKETLPYYVLPGGYGQIKKTTQGLGMFDEELPLPGSYTDSGNLRFPVEDTIQNRIQAGLFGQWANENAGEYFDREEAPLKEKQIQEFKELDIPIADYWDYRKGLKEHKKTEDKLNYIADLDIPFSKKNIMANNVTDRKEPIDMEIYDDFGSLEEFDFAMKNPEKYTMTKAVGGFKSYKTYSKQLNNIKADKDSDGKTISGSRKEKVINYVNGLDAVYGAKLVLFKSEYPADDTYNYEIIDYLNNKGDISYEERAQILRELGFIVEQDGTVRW